MKKTSVYIITLLILLVITETTHAQASTEDLNDALGFDNSVSDVPEAPIHFLIGFAMLIAVYIGYNKLARTEMNKKT